MISRTLKIGEDNSIVWHEMKRETTGEFVNDATVSFALKDSDGGAVAGATGPMNYVPASDGRYQGTLEGSVVLVAKAYYTLEVTAEADGWDGFRRIRCIALYHEAEE